MITAGSFLAPAAPFSSGFELAKDPLGPLAPEEFRLVPSSADDARVYKVMRRKNYYQCSCPSFIYQYETPWEHRTCKHLISLRGKDAEDERHLAAMVDTYGPTGKKPSISPPISDDVATLGPLEPEETRRVHIGAGETWTVMRRKDYYQCTCPAFKFQKAITWECRTCKHIKHLRGVQEEKERTDAAKILRGLLPSFTGKKVRRVKKMKESDAETLILSKVSRSKNPRYSESKLVVKKEQKSTKVPVKKEQKSTKVPVKKEQKSTKVPVKKEQKSTKVPVKKEQKSTKVPVKKELGKTVMKKTLSRKKAVKKESKAKKVDKTRSTKKVKKELKAKRVKKSAKK